MAEYIFDLILAGIVVLNVLFYGFRGFFRSLWKLLSFAVSIFLASCFGALCGEKLFLPWLSEKITDADLAALVAKICGYIAVFVVCSIVLAIIGLFIRKVKDTLDVKRLDAVLGSLLGLAIGLITVFVVCLAVSVIVELNLSGFLGEKITLLKEIAEDSYVFRFFCQISSFDYVNIKKVIGEGIDKAKEAITAAESAASQILP